MNIIPERYAKDIKDKAILSAWVAGLLLFISLLWILTQPVQTYHLMRTVNAVFINNNDMRRVTPSAPQKTERSNLLGYWYSMYDTTDRMFVFAVFRDGILAPLGAIVSDDGKVNEVLPLSAHAVQIFDTIPESIIQMYVTRIEKAVAEKEGNR